MTTDRPLRVLILGAGSGIAQATGAGFMPVRARSLASLGAISGRLADIAADLGVRGATQVETFDVDFTTAAVPSTLAAMADKLGGLDHVILAYGVLGAQALAEGDLTMAEAIIDVNFRSAAAWSLAVLGGRHLCACAVGARHGC
jgi:decaprenylphospho-beta-D-erythro-pentofuranosid-2-ulose 2-reductase